MVIMMMTLLMLMMMMKMTFVLNGLTLYSCVWKHLFDLSKCSVLRRCRTELMKTNVFKWLCTVPPSLNQTLPAAKRTKKELEPVHYSCAAYAKPAANITWTLDGELLINRPPFAISTLIQPSSQSKVGKTLSYLTMNEVSWKEGGTYSCLAKNVAGQKRQETELEIQCKFVLQGLLSKKQCSKCRSMILILSLTRTLSVLSNFG